MTDCIWAELTHSVVTHPENRGNACGDSLTWSKDPGDRVGQALKGGLGQGNRRHALQRCNPAPAGEKLRARECGGSTGCIWRRSAFRGALYSVESNLCRRGQYNGGHSETTIRSPLKVGGHVIDGWITVTCSADAQTGVPLFVLPQRASSWKHRATNGRKLNGAPRNLL